MSSSIVLVLRFAAAPAATTTLRLMEQSTYTSGHADLDPGSGATISMWTTGFGGTPTVPMSTADGIGASDAKTLDLNIANHAHAGRGFSHAGTHDLQFDLGAAQGTPVSGQDTDRFVVSSRAASTGDARAIRAAGSAWNRRGRRRLPCRKVTV